MPWWLSLLWESVSHTVFLFILGFHASWSDIQDQYTKTQDMREWTDGAIICSEA